MPSEKELLERIRQLEQQNNELQDKLDMIWAILAPDYDEADEEGSEADAFVHIKDLGTQKKPD